MPMTFNQYLAATLGTRNWCVASRLTDRMRERGYDLAISQKKFAALRIDFDRSNARTV